MVDQNVNFKKMADERYRVYRIIRSNQLFTPMYRSLLSKIGKYPGAIIFPEQLLGVDHIYSVSMAPYENSSATVFSCLTIRVAEVFAPDGEQVLKRAEDVLDVEQKITDSEDKFRISSYTNSSYYNLTNFSMSSKNGSQYWFSNSRDATKFASSQIRF